MLTRIRSGLRQ